jgi:hypothetical protein
LNEDFIEESDIASEDEVEERDGDSEMELKCEMMKIQLKVPIIFWEKVKLPSGVIISH